MHLRDIVWKDLRRRPLRSSLTAVGIATSIAAVILLLSVSRGLQRDVVQSFDRRGVDLVVVRAGVTERLTSSLREDSGKLLAALPQVADAAPALRDLILIDGGGILGMPLAGWPVGSFLYDGLALDEGALPTEPDSQVVLLGAVLAEGLGKRVGDELQIEGSAFRVAGIFRSRQIVENGSAIMPLAAMQNLMDRQGQVTEFLLRVRPSRQANSLEVLRAAIANLRDEAGNRLGLSALPTEEYVGGNTRIRLAHGMAWITAVISLAIGAVGMLNTMLVAVLERTQEIGTLRAIGWRRFRIVRLILSESLALSAAASLLGLLGAWVGLALMSMAPAARALAELSLSPAAVAVGWCLALAAALLGGGYPAWRAANLSPVEALRDE